MNAFTEWYLKLSRPVFVPMAAKRDVANLDENWAMTTSGSAAVGPHWANWSSVSKADTQCGWILKRRKAAWSIRYGQVPF